MCANYGEGKELECRICCYIHTYTCQLLAEYHHSIMSTNRAT